MTWTLLDLATSVRAHNASCTRAASRGDEDKKDIGSHYRYCYLLSFSNAPYDVEESLPEIAEGALPFKKQLKVARVYWLFSIVTCITRDTFSGHMAIFICKMVLQMRGWTIVILVGQGLLLVACIDAKIMHGACPEFRDVVLACVVFLFVIFQGVLLCRGNLRGHLNGGLVANTVNDNIRAIGR